MAPWVTGVKTGHTFGAGYVLVGSGRRKGVELISVAIGAPTDEDRFGDNLDLLEYGFSQYRRRLPIRAGAGPRRPVDPLRRRRAAAARRPHASRSACAAASGSSVAVRAPGEVEGPIRARRQARPGDGLRRRPRGRRRCRCAPAARSRRRASSTAPAASSATTRSHRGRAFVILIGGILLWRLSRRSDEERIRVTPSDPHRHPQRGDRPHRRGAQLPPRPPPPRGREPHRRRRQGDQRRPRAEPARPPGDRHRLRRRPDRRPGCSNSCARSRC